MSRDPILKADYVEAERDSFGDFFEKRDVARSASALRFPASGNAKCQPDAPTANSRNR